MNLPELSSGHLLCLELKGGKYQAAPLDKWLESVDVGYWRQVPRCKDICEVRLKEDGTKGLYNVTLKHWVE